MRSLPRAPRPRYVWLLWFAATALIVACPSLLSDPGMWAYLLDPELLALLIVVSFQFVRVEVAVAFRTGIARLRRGR